jgi:malate synthase
VSGQFLPAYGPAAPQARLAAPVYPSDDVVTAEALALMAVLARAHGHSRDVLLEARRRRRQEIADGAAPGLTQETAPVNEGDGTIPANPLALMDRQVEIRGPANPKLTVSALKSGTRVLMADLGHSLSPTWGDTVEGHRALTEVARGDLKFQLEPGEEKRSQEGKLALTVQPRGLHLIESHVLVDGVDVAATLFDISLLALHIAPILSSRGSGLYLHMPELEHHHETEWWDAVLADVERRCLLPASCIRVTVLLEHVPTSFEIGEILFPLRDRVIGLNSIQ